MVTVGKFFGCVMMIVGSAIGVGVLATPMISAEAGFTTTIIVILILWALLTISGLLVAEASLMLPKNACSFNSMAERTLGPFGRTVTWVSYLLMLYATLTAYVSGGPDLIFSILQSASITQMPRWLITVLFTGIMGSVVFWSTKATDFMNRGLISVKGILLITTLALISVYIDPSKIFTRPEISQVSHVLVALPILLCLFSYHFVIPSIRMYVGHKPRVIKWIIITATTICLVVYLLWLAPTLSMIPLEGENGFAAIGGSLGKFTRALVTIVNNRWVKYCIHGFTNISMTTAFLGVSLGIFDFLADGFKRPNTRFGRLQTACLTFFPPLLINILYPDNFLKSFSYSGVFVAILFLILPPIMVYRLRKNPELNQPTSYHVIFGKASFAVIIIFGFALTVFPILTNLGLFTAVK
ncbi:MAG: hypothetical protein KKE11_03545 [Gammaproteobacteria bacterium]|nr:hypothetical protein [Gammaproteobacteria bacterium]